MGLSGSRLGVSLQKSLTTQLAPERTAPRHNHRYSLYLPTTAIIQKIKCKMDKMPKHVLGNTIQSQKIWETGGQLPSPRLQAELFLVPLVCFGCDNSHFTLLAPAQPQAKCCRNEQPCYMPSASDINWAKVFYKQSQLFSLGGTRQLHKKPLQTQPLVRVCERPIVEGEMEGEREDFVFLGRWI